MSYQYSGIPGRPQPQRDYLSTPAVQERFHPRDISTQVTQHRVTPDRRTEGSTPGTQISDIRFLSNTEGSACHPSAPQQAIGYLYHDNRRLRAVAHSQICPSPNHITQEYLRYFTMHPIIGMVAELDHSGRVIKVYGPPLDFATPSDPQFPLIWCEVPKTAVPQRPYVCGTKRNHWKWEPPIRFSRMGYPGVRLVDAVEGYTHDMDDGDDRLFDDRNAVTVRIHFQGYCSSTEIERTLKQMDERHNARSMRISTVASGAKVTKEKLVKEVSKRVQWYVEDLEENRDLFPFNDKAGEQWRLGSGRMKFEHMVITGLNNVSDASWSPVVYIELDPIEYGIATSLVS